MRPLTNDRPKNMVEVAGKPIVDRQTEWLKANGVTDVVFLCRYLHEVLEAHVGDGSPLGVRAQYSVEREPLGRGGALKEGWSYVPVDETEVIACNADILTDQSLTDMLALHRERGAVATLMLAPLRSPYGIVDVDDDGRIQSFREKPVLPHWLNGGVYVLSREIVPLLPDRGDHENSTFPLLATEGRLIGYKSNAYWRPVDSVKDVSEAEKELAGAAS